MHTTTSIAMIYRGLIVVAVMILGGCEMLGVFQKDLQEQPLETSRSEYVATVTSEQVVVDIPYVFDNKSSRTLYVPRCHKPDPPVLEKKVSGQWEMVYGEIVLECLGPPLEIEGESVYRDTLEVRGHRTDQGGPRFSADQVPGTYRLVWEVYRDEDDHRVSDLLPLDKRSSNEFAITRTED